MGKNFKWDRKYFYIGLTAFCVIALSVLFFFIVKDFGMILAFIKRLSSILSPFIWGLVVAYIMHPIMENMQKKMPKGVAVLICLVIVILVLVALVALIIPQLIQSLQTIVTNSPLYYERATSWLETVLEGHPDFENLINGYIGSFDEALNNMIKTRLLPSIQNIVSNITSGVYSVLKGVLNVLIGIIVAVYVLGNIAHVKAGTKKILYSIFTIPAAEKIRDALKFVDETFMKFFTGKLLDSLVVGILCYLFCVIAKMPYELLVSLIVGVTNIIPFFGPFIGAVPCAILILLVSPIKCLVFVIFIIVLQQIDGNIIGPKILSSSIGINGFWVMFAIIIGGGLFGFVGMIVGVPVFVCIYTAIKSIVNKKLIRSDLPIDSETYVTLDHFDRETGEPVPKEIE